MRSCNATISLRDPIRSDRIRDFRPPWRTVFVYRCPKCRAEIRVFATSFRGKTPVPSLGAVQCSRVYFD